MTLRFLMGTKIVIGPITTSIGYLLFFLVPMILSSTIVDTVTGTNGQHRKSVSKNYSDAHKSFFGFEQVLRADRKYLRHNKLLLGKYLKELYIRKDTGLFVLR